MYFKDQCISYNEEGYATLPINNYFHHAQDEDLYEVSFGYNNSNLRAVINNFDNDDAISFIKESNIICCNSGCLKGDKLTFQGKKKDLEKIFEYLKLYPSEESNYILVNFTHPANYPSIVGNSHAVIFNFNCNT